MKHTLFALLLAATAAQSGQCAQSIPAPAPEQIRSAGRMAVSQGPALPAVTGGGNDGWVGGELPPFTPPEKPMINVPLRDTDVCRGPDGTYYLTGTAADFWRGNLGIPLWKSRDLKNWEFVGYIWSFPKNAHDWQRGMHNPDDSWTHKPMWGPRLNYIKGQWVIVYSIEFLGCGILKSTTGRPEGPYTDLKSDPIPGYDAALFEDEDGQVYFLNGAGAIARMQPDLSDLAEPLRPVSVAPGAKLHHCEGSHMVKLNGRYYLLVAMNSYHDTDGDRAGRGIKKTYDVWAMLAPSPYGPFEKMHLAFPRAGRNSLFQDNSGHWWSTWGTNAQADAAGLPFFEKPAIIPVEMDSEGKLRQAPNCD